MILRHPEAFDLEPLGTTRRRELARTPHYWIDEHHTKGPVSLSDAPGFRILMCVAGTARTGSVTMRQGSTVIVPACALDAEVNLDGTLLEIGVPA